MRTIAFGLFAAAILATGPATAQSTNHQPVPGPTTASAEDSSVMSERQVLALLRSRGYDAVQDLRREGPSYFGRATHLGEQVAFRVDARSGELREPDTLTDNQLRAMLRSRGFDQVASLERDGSTVRATARRADRAMRLTLDARNGAVLNQTIAPPGE